MTNDETTINSLALVFSPFYLSRLPSSLVICHCLIHMSEIVAPAKTAAPAGPWTRQNPFPGKLVVNRRLSSDDSAKDTRHFEIDLTGWGLSFEPGDSVAVYPTNDPNLVNEILRALGAKGTSQFWPRNMKPFREALLRDYSITQPTPKFLKRCSTRVRCADADGIAALGSQTRSRKLPLGCRSDRFLARASLRKVHAGGIRRSAHQIAASALFGRIEPARFSESSAPDCRCCAV